MDRSEVDRAATAAGSRSVRGAARAPEAWWSLEDDELLRRLGSSAQGVSREEAAERARRQGDARIAAARPLSRLRVLADQLRNPLLLILLFAAAVSAATGEWPDAAIVGVIVLATIAIGFQREYGAQAAAAALRERVRARATVLRDGRPESIAVEQVVPGDVFLLAAGSLVPADARVLEATDSHVGEAVLTGESFPVPKWPGTLPAATPVARRTNCVLLGTNVRSGTARCLAVATGRATELGRVAHRLALRPPETEFQRGIRRFGTLLTVAMLVLVLLIFAAHVVRGRPPVETLLFSIALAVGLSPELLPAILTVNLGRGARMMSRHGVLVRRLEAIENLGSMDLLCTDKTGTLTEGVVRLDGAWDPAGTRSEEVLELAAVNARFESGLPSPLDDAILEAREPDPARWRKLAEIPFDFVRKRVSVAVRDGARARLVAKGAFAQVVGACARLPDGAPLDARARAALERRFEAWSAEGVRVLAVADKALPESPTVRREDESDLTFAGFLTFLDRPKEGIAEAIAELTRLGVAIKLITGDNRLVARHVAASVGLPVGAVLSGAELDRLPDEALRGVAPRTDLFVEVDPVQKERILRALRAAGHVVGFLGDGVNDAPAMHAADASISVEQAVDVAREAADFVLLERDLDVLRRGIEEGRRTFANTLKYVLTTTSANLGNMVSMALASLFLPFLPMLASQILLNNLLSDVPAVGLADDSVDPELVDRPRRWDLAFVGRFMVEFGVLSSLFDLMTFAVLLGAFAAGPELFRTAWFVESLLTELVIALVVRTRRRFFRSRPGALLLGSTLLLIPFSFALPWLPFAGLLGFVPLPAAMLPVLAGITALYVAAAEATKSWFYRTAR